jgi:acyl-CoA hydrolase
VTARMTPDEAALQLGTADTIGMPHGPGQPQAFLEALGRRTDWTDLRIFGAALQSAGGLFAQPGVHYLSMFYDPAERLLRDSGPM